MIYVNAGLGIEDDNRIRKQICARPHLFEEIRARIAARDVEQPLQRIERVGGPGGTARDRNAARIPPGRARDCLHALIVWGGRSLVRDHVGFPRDLSGLGVERIHPTAALVAIAAGIADEDEAIPRDRRRRYGFALLPVGDSLLPKLFSPRCVIGEDAAILRPAEQAPIQVSRAAVHRERPLDVLMYAPFLLAGRG